MEKYLVSVVMMTFNREALVARALDHILSQKTAFPFEVVVGDDASTDGTRSILEAYKDRFPGQIKLRYAEKNEGVCQNFAKTYALCTGKYIATCDSDDYWVDSYKLARQVGFLEANLDYSLVTTGYVAFFGTEVAHFNGFDPLIKKRQIKKKDLGSFKENFSKSFESVESSSVASSGFFTDRRTCGHASTWVFRNELKFYPEWFEYPRNFSQDYIIFFMLSVLGKRYDDLPHISTIVHIQEDGWCGEYLASPDDMTKHEKFLETLILSLEGLKKHLGEPYRSALDEEEQRLLLIFFKAMRKAAVLRLKWHGLVYMIRLSPYIDRMLLSKYSNKSALWVFLNQRLLDMLRKFSKRFPPLFPQEYCEQLKKP